MPALVEELAAAIEEIAPLEKADLSWDNVGILLQSSRRREGERGVMLAIDLTHEVLDECERRGIRTVMCYHPVIFSPLKRINGSLPLIQRCVEMRMSVFSPHTALDGCENGLNEWLISHALSGGDPVKGCSVSPIKTAETAMSVRSILESYRAALSRDVIRYVLASGHTLDTVPGAVAAAAGSAAPLLKKIVRESQCNQFGMDLGDKEDPSVRLIITGEMSHHDLLYFKRSGCSVILLEHSNSERGFLGILAKSLKERLPDCELVLSESDQDPVEFHFSAASQ